VRLLCQWACLRACTPFPEACAPPPPTHTHTHTHIKTHTPNTHRSTFLGSRALAGTLLRHNQLAAVGVDGVTLRDVMLTNGVTDPEKAVAALALDPAQVCDSTGCCHVLRWCRGALCTAALVPSSLLTPHVLAGVTLVMVRVSLFCHHTGAWLCGGAHRAGPPAGGSRAGPGRCQRHRGADVAGGRGAGRPKPRR
jgi:hypothetical protein